MNWAHEDNPAERAVDFAATAVFAAALAFALGAAQLSAALAIGTAAVASVAIFALLRNVSVGPDRFVLPVFEPTPIELFERPAGAELLLDDVLGDPEPDSRVVRLFDPKHMPPGGEAPGRVNRDASQALSEALAELRRALR